MKTRSIASCVALACLSSLIKSPPAIAQCAQDFPSDVILWVNDGDSVIAEKRISGGAYWRVTVDCKMTAKEWKDINLPRNVCVGAAVKKPGSSEACKILKSESLGRMFGFKGSDYKWAVARPDILEGK